MRHNLAQIMKYYTYVLLFLKRYKSISDLFNTMEIVLVHSAWNYWLCLSFLSGKGWDSLTVVEEKKIEPIKSNLKPQKSTTTKTNCYEL